jgi:SAM-dependent methyltransferase
MTEQTGWAAFFNEHAPRYEENVFTKNTGAEVDFLITELGLRPGATILDVGCGTGRHAIELARRGFAVTALDISAGMLAEARRHAQAAGVRVDWRQEDATRFALASEFDAVICLCEGACGLLASGDDPIAQPLAILRNVSRALKPCARCLFTVLNGCALIRKHIQADVKGGLFDPATLSERSECAPPGSGHAAPIRERGFVPTELVLLFAVAGMNVLGLWGGTAGAWGKRPLELDEIEIMVLAAKADGAALGGGDT